MAADQSKKQSTRQVLVTVLKVCISVALLIFLMARIGVHQLLLHITTANPFWIITSILTFMISNVLGAFQWFLLLKSKKVNISLWKAIKYYHVGLFFNNFLIGYVGGDAFRIYDIHKLSGDTNSAISTVFFDRFVGFFALTSLAMIVTLIWLQRLSSQLTVLTIGIVFMVWIFGLYLLFREDVARKFSFLFKLVLPKILTSKLKELYYALNEFRHNKMMLIEIFVIAIGVQSLRILTHLFAARSVGVNIDGYYFFIFIPIVAMAASLPISLGGIGVREQSGVTLFAQVGIASARVVAFEFIAYLVGIIATIPGGIIFAFRKEHTKPEID